MTPIIGNAERPSRGIPVVAIALLGMATILGVWSAGDNVHALDLRVSTRVQQWQGSLPSFLQRIADMSGDTIGAIVALTLLLIIAILVKRPAEIRFVMVVACFRVVCMFLKDIFNSPRPTGNLVELLRHYDNTGYPSGHSATAAMIATALVILVFRHTDRKMIRWLVLALAAGFALLVGWSRIWAGAHWPTDVLGGWSYGVGFTLLASWIVFNDQQQDTTSPDRATPPITSAADR
ncbi:MAG: phosphatase PAP2 family protein [Thermomicrobiales bacterium]|nr:phosphatase PAP2 family protein [Thermomicrobiales bacterium]